MSEAFQASSTSCATPRRQRHPSTSSARARGWQRASLPTMPAEAHILPKSPEGEGEKGPQRPEKSRRTGKLTKIACYQCRRRKCKVSTNHRISFLLRRRMMDRRHINCGRRVRSGQALLTKSRKERMPVLPTRANGRQRVVSSHRIVQFANCFVSAMESNLCVVHVKDGMRHATSMQSPGVRTPKSSNVASAVSRPSKLCLFETTAGFIRR